MKTAAKKRNSRASGVIALMLVLASALVFASSATASSASHVGPKTRAEVSERFTLKSIESIATSAANATRYYDCLGGVALECTVAPNSAADKLTGSALKSFRSLEQRVAEHTKKLADYRANPDAFDNLGLLKNAPTPEIRQRIIDGRIRHLEQEIKAFTDQMNKLLGGG
jgi:hypothetical protein